MGELDFYWIVHVESTNKVTCEKEIHEIPIHALQFALGDHFTLEKIVEEELKRNDIELSKYSRRSISVSGSRKFKYIK